MRGAIKWSKEWLMILKTIENFHWIYKRQNIFKYSWKIIKMTNYLKLVIQLRNEKSIRIIDDFGNNWKFPLNIQ